MPVAAMPPAGDNPCTSPQFRWASHLARPTFRSQRVNSINLQMREENIILGPGEMFVVPKGAEHRPVAEDEAHLLLIEPSGTPNTGNPATAAARRVI